MEKVYSILLYEKDKVLNSILIEQLSFLLKYEIYLIDDETSLFRIITEKPFDICIINLNNLEGNLLNFIKIYKDKNNHKKIIIYHQTNIENRIPSETEIIYLRKPFKLNTLFNYLKDIETNKKIDKIKINLMKNLIFIPVQKTILNINTNQKEHLTEKETDLLKYLFENQNVEISKSFLLTSVWGIKENINTHTLETHLYRLKQKLHKLEKKMTFSLINQNGKYFLKNNH